jgi:hypothetical protein
MLSWWLSEYGYGTSTTTKARVCFGSFAGSVVTWRRAQMVLLSVQGMPVDKIAEVTFTSADRIRGVIHNFNADGFDSAREPWRRRRATYNRSHGVRHLFAAYDLGKDRLYGHIKKTKNRSKFLEFCRYLRSLHPSTSASRSFVTITRRT